MIDFMENSEMRDLIKKKANSREWWIIPGFCKEGYDFICAIEEKFYMNENNDKFELLVGTFEGIFGSFAIAAKSEMSLEDLKEFTGISDIPEEVDFITVEQTPISIFKWLKETEQYQPKV